MAVLQKHIDCAVDSDMVSLVNLLEGRLPLTAAFVVHGGLVICSSLVDEQGTLPVYSIIYAAMRDLCIPFSAFHIYAMGTKDPVCTRLPVRGGIYAITVSWGGWIPAIPYLRDGDDAPLGECEPPVRVTVLRGRK